MTRLSLIFPPPSPDYHDVIWSAKDAPSAPQTAPAELGAYVKAYATSPVQVQAINPQIVENGIIRYRTIDEIAALCRDSDIVGLICLYHNQETAQRIAEAFYNNIILVILQYLEVEALPSSRLSLCLSRTDISVGLVVPLCSTREFAIANSHPVAPATCCDNNIMSSNEFIRRPPSTLLCRSRRGY